MLINDQEFEEMINQALDQLPQDRIAGLKNIAITFDDQPSPQQRKQLHLRGDQTLYGLYEGIPLTRRPAANSILGDNTIILPDKITIFKLPICHGQTSKTAIFEQVKHTLWHEIAHYYGLDHKRIHELE